MNDKEKLRMFLAEAESRGLLQNLPDQLRKEAIEKSPPRVWRTAPGGYFYRNSDSKEYIPNDKVAPFLESRARFSLLRAGRGSGKSAAGAQKSLKKIMEGEPGAVYNPSFTDFVDSTWPEFKDWIPWDYVIGPHRRFANPEWKPTRPFTIVFKVGHKFVPVICKGLKDERSARGPNINWLWYDEGGSDETGASWKIAIPSVRIGNDPQAFTTTTPAGKSHWVYEFFVDQDIPDEVRKLLEGETRELFAEFFTDIYSNQDNLDPFFFASVIAAYGGDTYLRRQEIYGEFVAAEGSLGIEAAGALRNNLLPIAPPDYDVKLRFWDLAATEKKMTGRKAINDPDETIGTLGLWIEEEKTTIIEDQVGGFFEWDDILTLIENTARVDGPFVRIVVEQEPGSGGKNQVAAINNHLRKKLPGWPEVEGWNPKDAGDRVMGANYWFSEARNGRLLMVKGSWNDDSLDQIADFPVMTHDDYVTSITGCRYSVAPIELWKNVPFAALGKKKKAEDESPKVLRVP